MSSRSLCGRALDLCTGSGAIAISLERARPTWRVCATDISEEALVVARDNALRLGAMKVAFAKADLFHGERLVRRGRPPAEKPKQAISLRVDADVLEHFKATGPGWQGRMNEVLRKATGL